MSTDTPGQPEGPAHEPSRSTPEVEYLGAEPQESPEHRSSGRRWGIVAAATAGVLGVAGFGAWGVTQFLAGGPAPATVVPDTALAYLALDLDPGAGQKVEAYQMLKKFPAIEERLGSGDDLRRSVVEALLSDAPCDDLDFADDFEPWLGNRIAVSAVPGEDEPAPFFVVQVTDQAQAEAGVTAVLECGGGTADDAGTAFVDDYMVVAETDEIAEGIVEDAEAGSLADDGEYQRWVDEAGGGDGIMTGYVSAEGPQLFMDALGSTGAGTEAGMLMSRAPALQEPSPEEPGLGLDPDVPDPDEMEEELTELLQDFEGAAMVLRFDDGALELETAASLLAEGAPEGAADSGLADLPASTAVALGFGVADGMVEELLDSLGRSVGEEELESVLREAEADTGLNLPEDLQTLLGDGVSVAVDSSLDVGGMFGLMSEGFELPVGARIVGDPDEIVPVLERLVAAADAEDELVIETGEDVVAVGLSPDHVTQLVEDGDLGDQDAFEAALPDFGDSTGGLFVDFDTDDWLTDLAENAPDEEIAENLAPLNSLGVTGQTDGDVVHGLVRLSTD